MSFENHSEEPKDETAGMTRRGFLKVGAALVGSAILAPEILHANPEKGAENLNEGEPGLEYARGMKDLRAKAITESNEFMGVYREHSGAGAWEVSEEKSLWGGINLEEVKAFLGEDPSHIHFVHTHPERQVGKKFSPPSLLDIQGVVSTNFFFEGQGVHIKHQAIDSTGVWTFELDPTSRFAVAMRYLQTKMPDVVEALIKDASFQKEALSHGETEDPRDVGQDVLDNTQQFGFRGRRQIRKMGKLEETLLADFDLEDFDREMLTAALAGHLDEQQRLEQLKEHYKKIGVTLSYEPFEDQDTVVIQPDR